MGGVTVSGSGSEVNGGWGNINGGNVQSGGYVGENIEGEISYNLLSKTCNMYYAL